MGKRANMKMTKAEKKEYLEPQAAEGPEYPYSLRITLNDDILEKLGVTSLPKVGDKITLDAFAHVVSVSASDNAGYGKSRNVELQITDLALDEPGEK